MKGYVTVADKELQEVIQHPRDLGANTKPRAIQTGQFKPGVSGNPEGRPVGALNKATLVKQAILAEVHGLILKDAPKVIKVVLKQAKAGCRVSQKLIFNSIIPSQKSTDKPGEGTGETVFKLVIENLVTHEVQPAQSDDIQDAEYEEIPDGN